MAAKKTILEREWLSTTDCANNMGCCTETIRRDIKSGKLKAQMFKGDYAIHVNDFAEYKAREIRPIPDV
jgi:IS30 family transposase